MNPSHLTVNTPTVHSLCSDPGSQESVCFQHPAGVACFIVFVFSAFPRGFSFSPLHILYTLLTARFIFSDVMLVKDVGRDTQIQTAT